ncbi:MAG: alkaline phosphatase D family protein [Planctomycetota bacterium]
MISLRICCLLGLIFQPCLAGDSRQATGVKVGEVSATSAIVCVRLTQESERNVDGIVHKGRSSIKKGKKPPRIENVDELRHACPGAAGKVRLRIGEGKDLADAKILNWIDVVADNDFTHQFKLRGLKPATLYYYAVDTAADDSTKHGSLRGFFETAPGPNQYGDVTFTVITGQTYMDIDHPDGFHIYESMGKLKPKFIVPTGDSVYYDLELPVANSMDLARYHWHRMYSFGRHIQFHLHSSGYWMVDDHDIICSNYWPGKQSKVYKLMAPMNFEKGERIFREQVPMGRKTYRTYLWGKGLQIWLVEGRLFRSPNDMPDGPGKSIFGTEQKRWLKESLLGSDADWKVLVSPTPIIGPDAVKSRNDNHATRAWGHEGNELRRWFQNNLSKNFFIVCGDRHWQYHSVHPETSVHEFSCGPASDRHAGSSPGYNGKYHKFHRVKGGFLSVNVRYMADKSNIVFRFHDVRGKVVYEYSPIAAVKK